MKNIEATIQGEGPDTVSTVLVEPIMSAVGVAVPPDEYLPEVAAIAKKYGCLLHVDEVINGFGRTGKMFAHQHYGVRPDIVAIAKGIVSAYLPIAATVVRNDVFKSFVGEAVREPPGVPDLDVRRPSGGRRRRQPQHRDHPRGAAGRALGRERRLSPRRAPHAPEASVGGRRARQGAASPASSSFATAAPRRRCPADSIKGVVDFARRNGVIVGRSGGGRHLGSTIVLSPPLVITRAEIDRVVAVLDKAIEEMGGQLGPS